MKNLFIKITLLIMLVVSSCSRFLEEKTLSTITSSGYYRNESEARENVNSLYRIGAMLRYASAGGAYIGPTASINSMLTGYFINSYEGQELVCRYARELNRQQHTRIVSNTMNSAWNTTYQGINIANGAIKYIPNIAMQEQTKKQLIAEAKFFRAFNYFYLVKMFGPVPLSVEPYESIDNIYLARTPEAGIFGLIEEDLLEAIPNLPNVGFANNGHRITSYVASMCLANVYLQQGKFQKAADQAKLVINSPHSLTSNDDLHLNSAFNKLRREDDLPEVIYAYEYNAAIRHSGWWPTYAFNSSATAVFDKYQIFERVYGPTNLFLNVYQADDLRIQPNQFFHWEYKNLQNGRIWSSNEPGIWYYFDEDAVLNTGRGSKDWNLYRYAEALLIAAESIASATGVNAEAAGYLAAIKARASLGGQSVADYTAALQQLSVDKFVEECWTERLRELPLEFKLWDDCLRTQKFPVISATEKGKVTYVNLIGATNAAGAIFKDSDLLWPISLDELQRNPKLSQNKDYEKIF